MKITFSRKAIPIPAEYRPLYKIAQILQVLQIASRGQRASLLKLHLFSWAFKSGENMDKLIEIKNNQIIRDIRIWGLEPSLNRALVYAVSEGLCDHVSGSYKLTEKGENFVKLLLEEETLLLEQRSFLMEVGKGITEKLVTNIAKSWKN